MGDPEQDEPTAEEAFGVLHEVSTGTETVLAEVPADGGVIKVVFYPNASADAA